MMAHDELNYKQEKLPSNLSHLNDRLWKAYLDIVADPKVERSSILHGLLAVENGISNIFCDTMQYRYFLNDTISLCYL